MSFPDEDEAPEQPSIPQFPTDRVELTLQPIPQFPSNRIEKGESLDSMRED